MLASLALEQREKDDSIRIARQRPVLRVCAELALVGIIRDGLERSGGEWIMKAVRDLVRETLCGYSVHSLTIILAVQRPFVIFSTPASRFPQVLFAPIPRHPVATDLQADLCLLRTRHPLRGRERRSGTHEWFGTGSHPRRRGVG